MGLPTALVAFAGRLPQEPLAFAVGFHLLAGGVAVLALLASAAIRQIGAAYALPPQESKRRI
jgi:hypothetical protein